jgi:hypothetical protein
MVDLNKLVNQDDFYSVCCYPECKNTDVQLHEPLYYAGKKLEKIRVPACYYHHMIKTHGRGVHGKEKDQYVVNYFRWVAINRIGLDYLKANYPKHDWEMDKFYLDNIYGVWE